MDGVSRSSQGQVGVQFENHRISSLLFADAVVLLASPGRGRGGRRPWRSEAGNGTLLLQVEEFKYLEVLLTSEGKMEGEIDRHSGAHQDEMPKRHPHTHMMSIYSSSVRFCWH